MSTHLDGRRPETTNDVPDQTSSASLELSTDRALDAVTRLVDLIEIRPLAIMDTKQLPLPKEDMKAALKLIWRTTSDRKMCDRVEVSFVRLSNFQDGVGAAPLEPVVPPNSPPERVATILDPYIAAASRVQAETHTLSTELNEFKRLFTQSGPESASIHSSFGGNRVSGRGALRE